MLIRPFTQQDYKERVVALNAAGVFHDLRENSASALVNWMIFPCGPISLARFVLRRRPPARCHD